MLFFTFLIISSLGTIFIEKPNKISNSTRKYQKSKWYHVLLKGTSLVLKNQNSHAWLNPKYPLENQMTSFKTLRA